MAAGCLGDDCQLNHTTSELLYFMTWLERGVITCYVKQRAARSVSERKHGGLSVHTARRRLSMAVYKPHKGRTHGRESCVSKDI